MWRPWGLESKLRRAPRPSVGRWFAGARTWRPCATPALLSATGSRGWAGGCGCEEVAGIGQGTLRCRSLGRLNQGAGSCPGVKAGRGSPQDRLDILHTSAVGLTAERGCTLRQNCPSCGAQLPCASGPESRQTWCSTCWRWRARLAPTPYRLAPVCCCGASQFFQAWASELTLATMSARRPRHPQTWIGTSPARSRAWRLGGRRCRRGAGS